STTGQLTDKQLRVIPFLLAASSIEEGCKRTKISKATIYGWLKEEPFRAELRRGREEITRACV
ncbi:MAG: IS630 transposase-related protein, partial [Candidatus Binatia bacterium]